MSFSQLSRAMAGRGICHFTQRENNTRIPANCSKETAAVEKKKLRRPSLLMMHLITPRKSGIDRPDDLIFSGNGDVVVFWVEKGVFLCFLKNDFFFLGKKKVDHGHSLFWFNSNFHSFYSNKRSIIESSISRSRFEPETAKLPAERSYQLSYSLLSLQCYFSFLFAKTVILRVMSGTVFKMLWLSSIFSIVIGLFFCTFE